MAIMDAKARAEADPRLLVIHQTIANCTNLLPKRENACPVKMTQNLVID
jgi:hypothetical protein